MKNDRRKPNAQNTIAPTAFWRSIPPNELGESDRRRLSRELPHFNILGEFRLVSRPHRRRRRGDRRGDPSHDEEARQSDGHGFAMSAVLLAALGGSAACRDFLAHRLSKRGAQQLSNDWREANRLAAREPDPARGSKEVEGAVPPGAGALRA